MNVLVARIAGLATLALVVANLGPFAGVASAAGTVCTSGTGAAMTMPVTNNSAETVNLLWVDGGCVEHQYQQVSAGASTTQSTFTGHIWRLRSVATGAVTTERPAVPGQTLWTYGDGSCSAGNGPTIGWTVTNRSAAPVDLYWLDGACGEHRYASLGAGQAYSGPTSVGAIWRVKRKGTAQIAGSVSVTGTTSVIGSLPAAPLGRATVERADDATASQIKVLYAVPAGGVDRGLDVSGRLGNLVAAGNTWLAGQSGGRTLRFDRYRGALDVTYVRLPRTEAVYAAFGANARDEIEKDLIAKGFAADNKNYLAVYEGATSTGACGGAFYPPTLLGKVVVLYSTCNLVEIGADPVHLGYWEFAALHETFHGLRATPACAPHQVLSGHVSDGATDLMYAGGQVWYPSVLDNNRDDYWGTNSTSCADLARSEFII